MELEVGLTTPSPRPPPSSPAVLREVMTPKSGQSAHSMSLAKARLMILNWKNENTLSVRRMGYKTEAAGCHPRTTRMKPV